MSRQVTKLIVICSASILAVLVIGCAGTSVENRVVTECADRSARQMDAWYPRHSQEIEVLYLWGVSGRNRIDTISGTLSKDLNADGTMTVPFELSDEQKSMIVQYADSIGFWLLPSMIAVPDSVEVIVHRQPCTEHLLRISHQNRVKTVMWSTCVQNPIMERDLVAPLGALIEGMATSSKAYKKLPTRRGWYL